MAVITNFDSVDVNENACIVTKDKVKITNSKIIFNGKGNVLLIEDGCCLENSIIKFDGDNSIVVLKKNRHPIKLNVSLNNNCTFFVGRDVYFNGILYLVLSEEKDILIGDQCLISFSVWFRNSDAHLIYDIETQERINLSQSIIVGDHVWIGQQVAILKGTEIGSGSIIGFGSVVPNKKIGPNESWAGNPAKLIKKNVFWDGTCVHKFTEKKTISSISAPKNFSGVFKEDRKVSLFKTYELLKSSDINFRIDYLKNL